jgi:UDP-3-O-[3-hydroxymyristoyl] glucosamine N-acyltransferase
MATLAQIAQHVAGRLDGPGDLEIVRLAPLDLARAGDLVFVKDERNLVALDDAACSAVMCREGDDARGHPAIRVTNPRLAAARVAELLWPRQRPPAGVHPTAVIAESATVGADCSIGPFVTVGADAEVGAGVVLDSHVVLGAGVRVGADTWLHPRVVLYPGVTLGARCTIHAGAVIGAEGFGVEPGPDGPVAFPQNGTVILGDDVRVGANSTIDRATFAATRIGAGTQIDNLVQIGHNVEIEEGVIVCALTGLAGGSRIETRAIMGPQAALSPNSVLGAGTILGARAATVSHQRLDDPGQIYMDGPPLPISQWMRFQAWKRKGRWSKRKST